MSQESLAFREAQPDDFPAIALLIERANAQRDRQPLPETLTDASVVESLVAKSNKTGAWTDVALLEGKIAGISLGYPTSETTDLSGVYPSAEYISLLMVEPEHWGKRIASLLLDRAAERARHGNKHQLVLLTRETDNGHARQFYEHKGYTQTGNTRPSKYGRQVLYLLNL